MDSNAFVLLGVIGMLSAAAGAYYYLRIVVVMYFGKPQGALEITGGWPVRSRRERLCLSDRAFWHQLRADLDASARCGPSGLPIHSRTGHRSQRDKDRHFPVKRRRCEFVQIFGQLIQV